MQKDPSPTPRVEVYMRLTSLLLVSVFACGGSRPPPPNAPSRPTAGARAGSALDNLPVAQYLCGDDATGTRVFELLRAAGIESSAGGSLGYSVWVAGRDRAKARELLEQASLNECLD